MTSSAELNILTERLIRVRAGSRLSLMTLPEVLDALGHAEALEFPALQPHQAHAWHAFLVQLAASALHAAGSMSIESAPWSELLLSLVQGDADAWALVREDLEKPAFMQPPAEKGSLTGYKTTVETPDALDVLLTAKNFDVKATRVTGATPEYWLLALVSKQTTEGFSGRDNYGVARMNGGFSSRPCVALAPDLSWGKRFVRDTQIWLERRAKLIEDFGYECGVGPLLWLLPWEGTEQLYLQQLDPFFIEVCRRIRLVRDGDRLVARTAGSKKSRIDLSEHKGATGDIWTPIDKERGASLTLSSRGFHYKDLDRLLFSQTWSRSAALEARPEDGDSPLLIARALVRGQGKTEGFHERIVPLPGKNSRQFFERGSDTLRLAKRSAENVMLAGDAAKKVLKPALLCMIQGGPSRDQINYTDARAKPWLDRFDHRVNEIFFTTLFETFESQLTDKDARELWEKRLETISAEVFTQAKREIPVPEARRPRTIALAELLFFGARKRVLPSTTSKPSTTAA